jgi:hypothetical protein
MVGTWDSGKPFVVQLSWISARNNKNISFFLLGLS